MNEREEDHEEEKEQVKRQSNRLLKGGDGMDFDDLEEEEEGQDKRKHNKNIKLEGVKNEQDNHNNDGQKEREMNPELDRLPFSVLVNFFREVQMSKGKSRKLKLQAFLNKIFAISREPSFSFTLLRLIMPQHDKSRSNYGLNYLKLANVLGDIFSFGDEARLQLRFYKRPQSYQQRTTGDFGEVVQSLLHNWSTSSSLTINQVDQCLDQLCSLPSRERSAQVNVLRRLFKNASAEEIKWITRLILKDLNLGINHEIILALYHSDAVVLFNTTSSLWVVCQECVDQNKKQSSTLRLFHPIKAMLAGRKTLKGIETILSGKEYLVETKYDGERIQCHISPEQVMFFTRNSNNYTNIYAKMVEVVRRSLSKMIECCILDGEMIVVNRVSGQAIQFGKNKTVALEKDEEDLCICYKVFDVLYLRTSQGNEFFLMNYQLKDRKNILQKIIECQSNRVEVVLGREYSDLNDILTEFNDALHRNEEGIVIKQLDTLYYPDDRSEKWIKMKGDYYDGIVDTLDLLIIGAYFGEKSYRINGIGDWTDNLTHYLLAVAKRVDSKNPSNSVFVPFARVATGFKERDLADIKIKLRHSWIRTTLSSHVPSYISNNWKPSESDKPDAYIGSPENSIIIEVRATEIIQSASYPTNFTLRFPRFEKLRRDKDWQECMKLQEILDLTDNLKKKSGKDSSGEEENGEDQEQKGKKKRKGGEDKKLVGQNGINNAKWKVNRVMTQFQDTEVSDVKVESNLLSGCVFNIINIGSRDSEESGEELQEEKMTLERDIVKYGGSKVQNDSEMVSHYIAGYCDFRVKAIAESYGVNVLSISWLTDSIQKSQLQDYSPFYIVYAQQPLLDRNILLYDKFGDPFYKDISKEELIDIFNHMQLQEEDEGDDEEESNLMQESSGLIELLDEDELRELQDVKSEGLWSNMCFSLYQKEEDLLKDSQLKVIKHLIEFKGGIISFVLQEDTDFIVALDYSIQQNQDILTFIDSHKHIQIISPQSIQNQYI